MLFRSIARGLGRATSRMTMEAAVLVLDPQVALVQASQPQGPKVDVLDPVGNLYRGGGGGGGRTVERLRRGGGSKNGRSVNQALYLVYALGASKAAGRQHAPGV